MTTLLPFIYALGAYLLGRFLIIWAFPATAGRRERIPRSVRHLVASVDFALLAACIYGGVRIAGRAAGLAELFLFFALGSLLIRVATTFVFELYFRQRQGVTLPAVLRRLIDCALTVVLLMAMLHFEIGVAAQDLMVYGGLVAVVGVVVFQSFFRDLMLGLNISLQGNIRAGEWVRIGEHEGVVVAIDWKTITLRTADESTLILPNQTVSSSPLWNYSRPRPECVIEVEVFCRPGARPEQVRQVLESGTAMVGDVLPSPRPAVFYRGEADGLAHFRVRFGVADRGQRSLVRSRVASLLWYRVARAGLLPFAPCAEETGCQASELIELFGAVPVFEVIEEKELKRLSRLAEVELYGPGEYVVRQGEEGDSLYVVESGELEVSIDDTENPEGRQRVIGCIEPGGFFGERSLLTGDLRSAHVRAAEETRLVVIGKKAMLELCRADPSLPSRLSKVMVERERLAQEELARYRDLDEATQGMLKRIASFFGISP